MFRTVSEGAKISQAVLRRRERSRRKLGRVFYERPTLEVAKEVIGKYFVYCSPEGKLSAKVVEVEAYIGQDDPACHAARGKTSRNEVMFGQGGRLYVYFIYGMYYCMNFVTEASGRPAAVLIRAGEPEEGLELMHQRSPHTKTSSILSGPGKFCRAFGITRAQNGLDLTQEVVYLEDRHMKVQNLSQTTRIGISQGESLLYRFFDADSKAVSKRT